MPLLHKREGTAEELHHNVLPVERGVWLLTPTQPAIVLGSSQKDKDVDHAFCAANGIDVVRRRSGGGAVYVHPTESLWIDIVVPRGDALWNDDIGKSMWWIGDWWVSFLADAGVTSAQVVPNLNSSNSTFPVLAVVFPPCRIINPAIKAGAAVVPVAFVAPAAGSVLPGVGFIQRLAVFVAKSYFTTIK